MVVVLPLHFHRERLRFIRFFCTKESSRPSGLDCWCKLAPRLSSTKTSADFSARLRIIPTGVELAFFSVFSSAPTSTTSCLKFPVNHSPSADCCYILSLDWALYLRLSWPDFGLPFVPFLFVSLIVLILFTNPSTRAGYDTRSIFKRSLTGLNSEFSFS